MSGSQLRTLKGGPLNGLKLHLSDPLAPALRYLCVAVDASGQALYAPTSVYTLRHVEQKTRTIRRYEYECELDDWTDYVRRRVTERQVRELRKALTFLCREGVSCPM